MPQSGLKSAHIQASANDLQQLGLILDHLVDALGGDPSCTLRRAAILADIDEHPQTTQAEIMDRMDLDKSTINRDMDWLRDHGCIKREAGEADGRVFHIVTYGYSKKNLGLALDYFDNSHKKLKDFLEALINMFHDRKPCLRDAKLLVSMADLGTGTRQELFARSYDAPLTTNSRALDGLLESGLIKRTEVDA